MNEGLSSWHSACLALDLFAASPERLKGIVIRARAGPVRDAFVQRLGLYGILPRKIHPGIEDAQLFGGLDLGATLQKGRIVRSKGLIETPSILMMVMAERCLNDLAAKLSQLLDADAGHGLILLDEGAEEGEACPPPLLERLAFRVDLDGIAYSDIETCEARFAQETLCKRDDVIPVMTALAARFGIDSLRAPWLAVEAASVLARMYSRNTPSETDIELAAALVFGHRATCMPEAEENAEPPDDTPPPDPQDAGDTDNAQDDDVTLPEELLIEAVKALLPEGLLETVSQQHTKGGAGSGGAGHRKKGNRRGRPLPSRPGRLDGRNQIDLVATLRAAAPWQPLRTASVPDRHGLHIRPSDIRVKRYEERSDRLLIFTVDASGSSAMARLGEAKGAIELLLAEAYARRDHVALVSFRGEGAELLLPPTRSLVQTKRRLAGLPGGGGTPLAAGLRTALDLGLQSRGKGLSPTIAVLTDGRANIALDGTANRAQAGDDASQMGLCLRAEALPAILLDTGNRPTAALKDLAKTMDAPYLPLPRADAQKISSAVSDALA